MVSAKISYAICNRNSNNSNIKSISTYLKAFWELAEIFYTIITI